MFPKLSTKFVALVSVLILIACPNAMAINSWTPITALSEATNVVENPRIDVGSDGTAVIFWTESINGNSKIIRYVVRPAGSSTFGAVQTLVTTAASDEISSNTAEIAVDGTGAAIAVWLYRSPTTSPDYFQYSVKPAGSNVFGTPQNLAFGSIQVTSNALDLKVAANDAGVFWIAAGFSNPQNSYRRRIITWKGSVAGFANPEIASVHRTDFKGNDDPYISVTPNGNAYLFYTADQSPTDATISYHNGTSWFSANGTTPTGIKIATGGSNSDGQASSMTATADGSALFMFRQDQVYGLYTNATNWTASGGTGSTNSTLIQYGSIGGFSTAADGNGNGLIVTSGDTVSPGGFNYQFVSPTGGVGPASFLASPSQQTPGVDVAMDSSGNAIVGFGKSSSVYKDAYVAYRPAGSNTNFEVEGTFPTPRGGIFDIQTAMGANNAAVMIFYATSSAGNRQLFMTSRTSEVATPDSCPNDPAKTLPGVCGCGKAESDSNKDTVVDCGKPTAFKKNISPSIAKATVSGKSVTIQLEKLSGKGLTYQFTVGKTVIKNSSGKATLKKLPKGKVKVTVQILQGSVKSKAKSQTFTIV